MVTQFKWRIRDPTGPVLNSYPACEPSCSCSSPAGTGFHSRCGRRWCCTWRSTRSLWGWTCSLPTVAGGTEAGTENGTCCVSEGQQDRIWAGHNADPGQADTRSKHKWKHINQMKNRSISTTMATDKVGKLRAALSVTWQADVMQNVTDAGLVPGRKQNTMGLETGSEDTVKYVVSDRTPQ